MKLPRKAGWKKWLGRMALLPVVVVFLLAVLELFYRNQWIDTYGRELNALNPAAWPANPRKKVLVMGDSFSAATNSWVNLLRDCHPDWQVVNSAVPGTTIYQARLMVERRLRVFQPDVVVYQVYVGNDLFDLRYPVHWGAVGLWRGLYWSVANRVRSLAWLNYSLGQLKRSAELPDLVPEKGNQGIFDPGKYAPRELLYLRAEPGLIANQALLHGGREEDMRVYLAWMEEFLAAAGRARCPVVVMVVPHCAQVHPQYAERMRQLGASGMDAPELLAVEYPFWRELSGGGRTGVHFVNLLPVFRAQELAGIPMYYLHDPHLSDAGQSTVTAVLDSLL